MKKLLSYPLLLVLLMAATALTTGCSSDDNDGQQTVSPLVGFWTSPYNDSPETTLTLREDGTFDYYVYGSGVTGKGDYTYDASSRVLSLFYNPKNSWGDMVWLVLTLDDTHLVVTNMNNGDNYTFTKKK